MSENERFSAQRSKLDETGSTSRRTAPAIDDSRASAGDDGRWSLRLHGVADGRHAVETELEATLQCRLDSGQWE